MVTEEVGNFALLLDRGLPIGNSVDNQNRRALHVKITNPGDEPIPVTSLILKEWDNMQGSHTTTTSTYTFKMGGSGGTLVGTIAITYSDSTKNEITNMDVTNV